jgi:hypothetical protein
MIVYAGLTAIRRGSVSLRCRLVSFWRTLSNTVRRVTGLTSKWNLNTVLGITDKVTVKLDFDDIPFKTVKYWAERTCSWFKLDGFIILKSSEDHYHVVFDRRVAWKTNVHIMSWVAMLSKSEKLKDYVLMQGIKESSTLRVGPKGEKPSPRIVFYYGKQDGEVRYFLKKREELKLVINRMNSDSSIANHEHVI